MSRRCRFYFRNETDYPDEEVKRLIRFAAAPLTFPSGLPIVVRVTYTRVSRRQRRPDGTARYGATGYAWFGPRWIRAALGGVGWEVVLRIGRPVDFPTKWRARYGYDVDLRDWRDALVGVAAHELKHTENHQLGIGTGGRAEEARCDAYAAARVRAFQSADPLATVVARREGGDDVLARREGGDDG